MSTAWGIGQLPRRVEAALIPEVDVDERDVRRQLGGLFAGCYPVARDSDDIVAVALEQGA